MAITPKDAAQPTRYLNGGSNDAWNKVYATVEEANDTIPNELDAYGVNFRSGKIVQIGTETSHKEYRWIDGFEDSNLIEAFGAKVDLDKLMLVINTNATGDINIVDENQNIGYQFTGDGTFRVYNIDSKTMTLNGEPLNLTELVKNVSFQAVKSIADKLNSSIGITNDGTWRIIDENGFIGLQFINGTLETYRIKGTQVGTSKSYIADTESDFIWSISDDTAYRNLAAYIDSNGEFVVRSVKTQNLIVTGTVTFPSGTNLGGSARRQVCYGDICDYILLLYFGQSNARGEGGGGNITTDQLGLLMPNSGLDSTVGSNYTDFIPYAASTETPIPGTVSMLKNLLEARSKIRWDKKDFNIVAGLPALGGATIQQISKGTAPYNKLLAQIVGNLNITTIKSKKLSIPAIPWTHGESNSTTSFAVYMALFIQLIEDLNADIKALYPDIENIIPFVGSQMNGNWYNESDGVSKVYAELGVNDPRYICTGPSYAFEYAREGTNKDIVVHLTPISRRIYGAYIGMAIFTMLYENRKFLPLHPIKFTVIGNTLQIKYYVPNGALVFDTATIPDPGNFGFRVLNAGLTDLTLSNIRILSDGETVSIDCSGSPAGGIFLYARNKLAPAFNIDENRAWFGARGCLRDTQGNSLKIDNYPMHNWAIASYLNIN